MPTRRFLLLIILTLVTPVPASPSAPPIDFSSVGFAAGGSTPAIVPAVLLVHPSGGDDTAVLQAALDRIATLPPQSDGFRGALLLSPGTFHVSGQLLMPESGVVLRGAPDHATAILATGHSRRTLIEIGLRDNPATQPSIPVTGNFIPAGAITLTLENTADFHAGDPIAITRPCTAQWIADLGMKGFPGTFADSRLDWTPGSRVLTWDRTITSVDPSRHQITLDSPITTAIEARYGGATIARLTSATPRLIGVEDLILDSSTDPSNPCDEQHAWIAVAVHTVTDAWVRNVTARHFAGSAVRVGPRAAHHCR
jgi:hypothetical protein